MQINKGKRTHYTSDGYNVSNNYNKLFEHKIITYSKGITVTNVKKITEICTGKWGWCFERMEGNGNGNCIISFEKKADLVTVMLSLNLSD